MAAKRKRPVVRWRDAILRSDLPPAARLVALALSQHMNYDTLDRAYPGQSRLARETGYSVRTVQRQLKSLEDRGWIEQTFKGGTKKSESPEASVYRGTYPGVARPTTQCHGSNDEPTTLTTQTHDIDDINPRHSVTPSGHDHVMTSDETQAMGTGVPWPSSPEELSQDENAWTTTPLNAEQEIARRARQRRESDVRYIELKIDELRRAVADEPDVDPLLLVERLLPAA